jgi:3-polyprenyl-4-hydroxybenzoate decarboxylase
VIVDDDIDPSNFMEVAWAMSTRSDPAESIEIIKGRTVSGIDARITPEARLRGDITMSQVLIDACRPYHWRDKFPKVNEVSPELKAKTIEKWGHLLF